MKPINSPWGRATVLLARALAGLLGLLLVALAGPAPAGARRAPNVVLIQVDDMSRSLLRAQLKIHGKRVPAMPNLLGAVGGGGVELDHYYASDPICGPSRASLLSGRAVHNHGMLINAGLFGYGVWRGGSSWTGNLPVWLQRAGYRTAHIGKYLNGYGGEGETEVPPGWDRWVTPVREAGSGYYGITLSVDGQPAPIGSGWQERDPADCLTVFYTQPGACLHSTDLFTGFALKEIGEARQDGRPFYLQLDYNAPHDDGRLDKGPTPPTRLRKFSRKVVPGYDLTDRVPKVVAPVFFRDQPPLTSAMKQEIRQRWVNEVLSVKGVDEGIGRILALLKSQRILGNTYVIFTSDNGMFHGEHRIAYGKYLPHEPSSRQPFLARGPGLPAGKVSRSSGSNLDVAPTVLAMTGTPRTRVLDGRSLLADLKAPRRESRVPVLLEGFNGRDPSLPEEFLDGSGQKRPNQAVVLNYEGFTLGRWKYIRYSYGDRELYDLVRDPGEEQNLAAWPKFAGVTTWADRLTDRLETCAGPSCRIPANPPQSP